MKKCPKCNKFKSLDLFPKTKQSKIACKSCKSEYDKKHYQKNYITKQKMRRNLF